MLTSAENLPSLNTEHKDLETRAGRRRSWIVRVHRLENQPGEDLSGHTVAEERLAMMWPLAVEAWRLSGRQLPEYSRSETPVRIITCAPRGESVSS